MAASKVERFATRIRREGSFIFVELPFSPRERWGKEQPLHVSGTIENVAVRGALGAFQDGAFLRLSAQWLRQSKLTPGNTVKVELKPESSLSKALPLDLTQALAKNRVARKRFDQSTIGEQKKMLRWVEGARTLETRRRRVREMLATLSASALRGK